MKWIYDDPLWMGEGNNTAAVIGEYNGGSIRLQMLYAGKRVPAFFGRRIFTSNDFVTVEAAKAAAEKIDAIFEPNEGKRLVTHWSDHQVLVAEMIDAEIKEVKE